MVTTFTGSGFRQIAGNLAPQEEGSAMAIVGWTSVAVGIAAVGLYVGRELRARYKFNHRTQYDFFSHAGDSVCAADYGTGI
jgi:hypothetical protein